MNSASLPMPAPGAAGAVAGAAHGRDRADPSLVGAAHSRDRTDPSLVGAAHSRDRAEVSDEGDDGAKVISFGDLMNLTPVVAEKTAEESEEILPTSADLETALPLMGVSIGGPLGVTIPPPVIATAGDASEESLVAAAIGMARAGAGTVQIDISDEDLASQLVGAAHSRDRAELSEIVTSPRDSAGIFTSPRDSGERSLAQRAGEGSLSVVAAAPAAGPAALLDLVGAAHSRDRAVLEALAARDDNVQLPQTSFIPAGPDFSTRDLAAVNAAPIPPAPVSVSPSHPEWAQQIAAHVTWSAKNKTTDVEIHLHPPELGALRVLMKIDGDRIETSFTAAVPETRAALEQHLPKLRELLAGQGLSLSQTSVSDQSAHQTPQFGLPTPPPLNSAAAANDEGEPISVVVPIKPRGLLDEYA